MDKKRRANAKFAPRDGGDDFDVTDWELPRAEDMLYDMLNAGLAEILEVASKDEVRVDFPGYCAHVDERSEKVDPLDLEVALPIARDEFDGPMWRFNLRDIVRTDIDCSSYWADTPQAYFGEEDKPYFRTLRDALRELAAEIEAALNRPPGPPPLEDEK